jgi:hypothetical protein
LHNKPVTMEMSGSSLLLPDVLSGCAALKRAAHSGSRWRHRKITKEVRSRNPSTADTLRDGGCPMGDGLRMCGGHNRNGGPTRCGGHPRRGGHRLGRETAGFDRLCRSITG